MQAMKKRKRFRSALRSVVAHAIWCGALAAILLLLPARFTAPARTVFLQAGGPLLDGSYALAGDAAAAAGTLRDALIDQESARVSSRQLQDMESKNLLLRESLERLRARVEGYGALDLAQSQTVAVSADVISYDTTPGRSSIAVAAGRRDGLSGGEVVAAGGAVVGTVAEAGALYSRVRLLTDPATSLPVRSMRTRQLYVLRGKDGVRCVLEMADRDQDVRRGDILLTIPTPKAGAEDPLAPPGLPLARVVSVQADSKRPLSQKVDLRPVVDLDRLEIVLVLIRDE